MSDALTTEETREQFVAGAMVTGLAYSRGEARGWFEEWLTSYEAQLREQIKSDVEALDWIYVFAGEDSGALGDGDYIDRDSVLEAIARGGQS